MKTPVVLVIFNRPKPLQRVFEAIAEARPSTLFVVADGPRANRPGEPELCEAARAVTERIDWPCEVMRDYSNHNLGCGIRLPTGLDWVFKHVPEAIIFEDDCLPSPDFFPLCSELLERYRDDRRVMHIAGTTFQFGHTRTSDSYYFSKYTHVWGWATWRRAWQLYDARIPAWPSLRESSLIHDWFDSPEEQQHWQRIFDDLHAGNPTIWDGQWTYTCWLNRGLGVVPARNLISNIGFGEDATHTFGDSASAALPLESLGAVRHPKHILRHAAADAFTFEEHYGGRQLRQSRRWDRRLRMAFGAYRRRLWQKLVG